MHHSNLFILTDYQGIVKVSPVRQTIPNTLSLGN